MSNQSISEKLKRIWDKLNNTRHDQIIPLIKANKKPFVIFMVSLVVLVGTIFLVKMNYALMTNSSADNQSNNPNQAQLGANTTGQHGQAYTYLPETKRKIESREEIRDPFAGTMLLKGIITGGGGKDMAIIRVGNTSHVAEVGTEIANGLTVEEVTKTSVILKSTEEIIYLGLNGKTKTEKIEQEKEKQEDSKGKGGGQ